ncbi:MAG: response regulator transcription factor [Gammaproteobacteria bacterium]|nr:response regulator transcription factor [Gammaproteobacteria bacterium]
MVTSSAHTAAKILIVDDDERLRRVLSRYLAREGYSVREAADGDEMRTRLAGDRPDLVILDLMLPDEDGLSLARELRAQSSIAIIMLTGKTDIIDRIVGLELGADDYVTKPFDERELLARVRTVLRRTSKGIGSEQPAAGSSAKFAGWRLDFVAHELTSPSGEPVHLTSSQFQLLASLVARPNRVMSREEILGLVSGRDWTPMDRSIDVLIGKLRKKIEPDPKSPTLIKTIRGIGYKFTAHVDFG